MKKEEQNILERCGNRRPFTVPDGYFDSITDSIMAALPEKQEVIVPKVTFWTKAKTWVWMAAAFAGVFFCVTGGLRLGDRIRADQTAKAETVVYSDDYIDSFMETAMIDDYTLYCALTGTSF